MKVRAIHLPTGQLTSGQYIQTESDLDKLKIVIHPLIFEGIQNHIKRNIPIFINQNGGYCPVKGTYEILN